MSFHNSNIHAEEPKPQLSDYFDIYIYDPNKDLDNLNKMCHFIEYSFHERKIRMIFHESVNGNIGNNLQDLKFIEFLGLYPTKPGNYHVEYFISCVFGRREWHETIFNAKNGDIQDHSIIFNFISMKLLDMNSVFNKRSYLDYIHQDFQQKFFFKNI